MAEPSQMVSGTADKLGDIPRFPLTRCYCVARESASKLFTLLVGGRC